MALVPRRWRGAVAICAVLVLLCAVSATAAEARPAAPPQQATVASLSIPSFVCGLVKYPVKTAAKKLIGLFAEEDIALLSAAVAAPLAEKWCQHKTARLKPIIRTAVAEQPALRPHIGPFVFNFYATATYWNQTYNRVTPWWSDFDLTNQRRYYYLWYSYDGTTWRRMQRTLLVPHGHDIQFAVRIVNEAGYSSPWTYSMRYREN